MTKEPALKFPRHKAAMYISHNEHKNSYDTVAQHMSDLELNADECGSVEEFRELLEGDEIWTIQWYPDTPIGFYRVCASTFERALELAIKAQTEEDAAK